MRAVRGTAIEEALVPPVKLPSKHIRQTRREPAIIPLTVGSSLTVLPSATSTKHEAVVCLSSASANVLGPTFAR